MSSDAPATAAAALSPADEEKKLGNDAFAAKNYDLALKHYTKAIELDPSNAVYYSNRSACYAGKLQWKESMEEAEAAVARDSKFMKAYYRLAVAQGELGLFDDAMQTINTGLAKEPENDLLTKLVLATRKKRAAQQAAATKASSQAQATRRPMSEAQKKEIIELQEQTTTYTRDLRGVQQKISNLTRDSRMAMVTKTQIEALPPAVPLYRAVGKAFIAAKDHNEVKAALERENAANVKSIKDLQDRAEYLDRRIASNTSNLRDLAQTYGM